MKTKQLIERNLAFSEKYIYLSITRGSIESGQLSACDNCGKLITNMVQVARYSDQKKYCIGTDCAETLSKAKCLFNNGAQTDYYVDIYAYNLCARFVTELKAGAMFTESIINCETTTRKGKPIQCYTSDLKKYFPEYYTTMKSK